MCQNGHLRAQHRVRKEFFVSTMQKRGIYEQIVRVLENNGGLILSHIAILAFYSYLFLAHWKPNNGLVNCCKRTAAPHKLSQLQPF